MRKLCIGVIGNHPTIHFAADELKKYLLQMDPHLTVEISYHSVSSEKEPVLWLGIDPKLSSLLPKVDDKNYDDAIAISVKENAGYITGTNERSVLIATYRFLTELGCRWVCPGTDGERIPQKEINNLQIEICENADYRHRGLCIEGACSYQELFDMIDYLPKVSMNTYFIQSMTPEQYLNRWYHPSHYNYNPFREDISVSEEELTNMLDKVKSEMNKRSILDHRGGHGWTREVFGKKFPKQCSESLDELEPELKALIAQTNGKRQLFEKHIDTTNLCYSNPLTHNSFSDSVVNFCKNNSDVDVVHIWLADMPNNHCECEECIKKSTSDWYVILLNEIDKKLTAEGLKTKLVFLLYYDLLWAPSTEKFNNPDRFVLMFAPASRIYGKDYGDFLNFNGKLPAYKRNKLTMPENIAENIAHLKNWQEFFKGDSFAYEYHLMWAHCGDIGYEKCAKNLYGDINDLKEIGLNGFISVQAPKTFMPTALPFYIMAKTLWNTSCNYEKELMDYYLHAYGEEGIKVHEYMHSISQLVYLYDQPPMGDDKKPYGPFCSDYTRLKALCSEFNSVIERNILKQDKTAKDWEILSFHSQYVTMLSNVMTLREAKKDEDAHKAFDHLNDFIHKNEEALEGIYDALVAPDIIERKIFKQK